MVQLQPKIKVIRALSAVIAKRAVLLYAIIDGAVLILLLAGIWALSYFFSAWWWLLLIVYIPLFVVSLVVYLVATFIASRLYAGVLSGEQKQHLSGFTDKILRLLETRGMGWWWFAFLCVRDLLFYRELRTLKNLLADATSLKNDLAALERELG